MGMLRGRKDGLVAARAGRRSVAGAGADAPGEPRTAGVPRVSGAKVRHER